MPFAPYKVDYSGRQLDIELLQSIEQPVTKKRVYPAVNHDGVEPPKIVSGIEKAVQRYAKIFLTEAGSVKFEPDTGNEFLYSIRRGMVPNRAYLDYLYNVANHNALRIIRADDADTETFGPIPDDERILTTDLLGLDIDYSKATVTVSVLITTYAGETYTYITPVASGTEAF